MTFTTTEEQNDALAATMRVGEMIVLADHFCQRMAANDFDLGELPVAALEKLRNAASAMETRARAEIVGRCRQMMADMDPTIEAP